MNAERKKCKNNVCLYRLKPISLLLNEALLFKILSVAVIVSFTTDQLHASNYIFSSL